MAVRDAYDVGVIMYTDTDLKPALETARSFGGHPHPPLEQRQDPALIARSKLRYT
jgi:hypothetical protein